jgi:hypothetical protein
MLCCVSFYLRYWIIFVVFSLKTGIYVFRLGEFVFYSINALKARTRILMGRVPVSGSYLLSSTDAAQAPKKTSGPQNPGDHLGTLAAPTKEIADDGHQ